MEGRAPIRRFDTVLDPSGGKNRVLEIDQGRLLLEDPDGVRFILAKRRLGNGWRHQPAEKPRRERPSRIFDTHSPPRFERRAA